ncbi:melanoma-associated antigen 10-like [Kogia breviceps]|uniref:melanoma-associated antigen 10-like n=1 Tax=Kogia breviceps TaxID=27615 RepID=UPI00279598E8|nr:melanoma-associated antigen 10-like [Kogia breviceps]
MLEEGSQAQTVPMAVQEDASSSSSTCSSPSFSSPLISNSPEEPYALPETLSPPQSPSSASSSPSPTAVVPAPLSQSDDGPGSPKEEGPSTSQALPDAEPFPRNAICDKVAHLVEFLLFKYRINEPTTEAEMLNIVIRDYEDHFPVIFSESLECMQLIFGLDVKEVDPGGHSYVLVPTLGLTYDGMLNDGQSMPKTGLLIFILSMIFMNGHCVPEKEVWESLNALGVCAGREHFIYGEPRELLTEVWVQEGYVEYRQVPNSDPACYEFLWGPRAHAEINMMSLLEFLAKVNGSDPRSFPLWFEECLRHQEE